MTRLEQTIEAANKAKEAIAEMEAKNAAMKQEIDDVWEARLVRLREKLQPIRDAFAADRSTFTFGRLALKTGVAYNNSNIILVINIEGGMEIERCGVCYSFGTFKRDKFKRGRLARELAESVLANVDDVVANMEKEFIKLYGDLIDNKFADIAKENDEIRKEWEEVCISDEPFYREEWTDNDIIDALTEAGKPVTKANIDEIKAKFLFNMSMEGVGIRRELLFDYAKEVG